jgi:hypothetical protein
MADICPGKEIGEIANDFGEDIRVYLEEVCGGMNDVSSSNLRAEVRGKVWVYPELKNLIAYWDWDESVDKYHALCGYFGRGGNTQFKICAARKEVGGHGINYGHHLNDIFSLSEVQARRCVCDLDGYVKVDFYPKSLDKMRESFKQGRLKKDFGGRLTFYKRIGILSVDEALITREGAAEVYARLQSVEAIRVFARLVMDHDSIIKPIFTINNRLFAYVKEESYDTIRGWLEDTFVVEKMLESPLYNSEYVRVYNQAELDAALYVRDHIQIEFGTADEPAILNGQYIARVKDRTVIAKGDGVLYASGMADVTVEMSARVYAYDIATVHASGTSSVIASGGAEVDIAGYAVCEAKRNASIAASGNSRILAFDYAKVKASGNALVELHNSSKLEANDFVEFSAFDESEVTTNGIDVRGKVLADTVKIIKN